MMKDYSKLDTTLRSKIDSLNDTDLIDISVLLVNVDTGKFMIESMAVTKDKVFEIAQGVNVTRISLVPKKKSC